MSTLANSKWKLQQDDGSAAELQFGPINAPEGRIGGTGTMIDSNGTEDSFYWVEIPNKFKFMLQLQNQSKDFSTLTTYSGSYSIVTGDGWFSNFSTSFSNSTFTISRL